VTPTIILLLGPSSAGKTTLAKALQNLLDEPFLHAPIDAIMHMVPKRCLDDEPHDIANGEPPAHGGFWWQQDADQPAAPLVTRIGPFGERMILAAHRAVRAFAESGFNLIVDDVIYQPGWVADYVELLGHHQVLLVAVRCGLTELERREAARRDRRIGQSRGDLTIIYDLPCYDVQVDTGNATPEDCAEAIRTRLEAAAPFQAWPQVCALMGNRRTGMEAGHDGNRD
jgi:chloramphenicol 3-O phosphotransferase